MNTRLLRKVQKHILANPKRVHMAFWGLNKEQIAKNSLAAPECGTVACISGWASVLSGHVYGFKTGVEPLGLTYGQSDRLFFATSWPLQFRKRLDRCKEQRRPYAKVVSDRIDHFIATKGAE